MSDSGASFGGQKAKFQGAGGTPGGIGEFIVGLLLGGVGFYMLTNRVMVQTTFGHHSGFGVFGSSSFGLTLLPLLLGIGVLFVRGKSIVGWVLVVGGLLFIAANILMNMHIYFQRTSLWEVIVMFGLIAAGLGLVARSLRPHKADVASE
jgi:hypothetical protein